MIEPIATLFKDAMKIEPWTERGNRRCHKKFKPETKKY